MGMAFVDELLDCFASTRMDGVRHGCPQLIDQSLARFRIDISESLEARWTGFSAS
jgi:hypothetical protein